MPKINFRIGSGFDVHPLVSDRPLILGGVHIPHERGLKGHSDADALLHSLCDAILGAIGQGDIGEHFPDNDRKFKDISSLILLETCAGLLFQHRYEIANIDVTVFAQEPRISPFKKQMARHIADVLHIDTGQVNIKATTTEKLGFLGRKEGIGAHSTVLIQSIQEKRQ